MADIDVACSRCGGGPATENVDSIMPCCSECWEALLEKAAQDEAERVREFPEVTR